MKDIPELFGSMVFNDQVMQERLPADTYRALRRTVEDGRRLDPSVAAVVASAMKDWAIEKGATHFTHWFQPMTGITAEKHDSFLTPVAGDKVMMEFSGKELIMGESDASSFPSGGLRATFEARGYTAWDATSYAFIKDHTLCIPTAFCSYGGEALDKKTPLLRSMEVLGKQALRVLRLFGNEDVSLVRTTVGPEQEYFLIDRSMYDRRKDLINSGRTLFGAKPSKGQELDDHYYGAIKDRVAAFMRDLDEELWKLGVLCKTEHNEGAPSQHEMAPFFTTANIAADHNQLTMEMMKKVAARHNLVCLLHEKPFAGVSGSGKHNNWSLQTDTGVNLLNPGDTPHENAQFLLFVCAVIKAVDEYQDMLRVSIASAGNDHRLGAAEAPPAVVSIFLGDELTAILEAIENGTAYDAKEKVQMKVGVHTLPRIPKDTTDRNRTSPFAFTGNKFEFRMLGSSQAVSEPNVVLNTAVAAALDEFASALEDAADFHTSLTNLIRDVMRKHKRIIFNGNGYDEAWTLEAARRGLCNYPTTADCLPCYIAPKNIALFEKYRVYSEAEMRARYDIYLQNYAKVLHIEAHTMVSMTQKDILPAALRYGRELAETILAKRAALPGVSCATTEETLLGEVNALTDSLAYCLSRLRVALEEADNAALTAQGRADFYRDTIIPAMEALRESADGLEVLVAKDLWPLPSYGDMLFSVR
ncbi:MAG: glutamine synthetase III [Clostridia bacterium]|nr:glutamine synthetase III [Clostridia bacterium]